MQVSKLFSVCLLLLLSAAAWAATPTKNCGPVTTALPICKVDFAAESGDAIASGSTAVINNNVGTLTPTFNFNFAGSPATASVVTSGCMRGGVASSDAPNCDVLETYTGTGNSIRSPTVTKVYDYFTVAPTFTGGTSPTLSLHITAAGKPGGGGAGAFATLKDVNYGTPVDGDFYTWSQSLSKLVDSTPGNSTSAKVDTGTIVSSDRNKWVEITGTTPGLTWTFTGAAFPDGWGALIHNSASGNATITLSGTTLQAPVSPNTSSSIVIPSGGWCRPHSDGTNLTAGCSSSSGGSGNSLYRRTSSVGSAQTNTSFADWCTSDLVFAAGTLSVGDVIDFTYTIRATSGSGTPVSMRPGVQVNGGTALSFAAGADTANRTDIWTVRGQISVFSLTAVDVSFSVTNPTSGGVSSATSTADQAVSTLASNSLTIAFGGNFGAAVGTGQSALCVGATAYVLKP